MDEIPPTVSGPLDVSPRSGTSRAVLRGMGVHAAGVVVACVVTPLVMGSNIWPIAAAFWGVMTVPVALMTGAGVGWLVRKRSAAAGLGVLVVTGVALAVAAGLLISRNR